MSSARWSSGRRRRLAPRTPFSSPTGFATTSTTRAGCTARFSETFRAHLSRPEFRDIAGRQFVAAGVYWPAKPFRETYGSDSSGTRGLQNPSNAMADAKAELEELKKDDATPAQRRKLDKAIKLLPKLEGNPKAQDDFVEAGLVVARRLDAGCHRRPAAGPRAVRLGSARETCPGRPREPGASATWSEESPAASAGS